MRKLRLDVEELGVESFETARNGQERGTVNAHATYTDPASCKLSWNWYCSVGDTCTQAAYTCITYNEPTCNLCDSYDGYTCNHC